MGNNTLKAVTISLGLLSAQTLFAQVENQINQQAKLTTNYELPTANCDNNQITDYRLQIAGTNQTTELAKNNCRIASPLRNDIIPISTLLSSISYLGVTPKLMMDPSTLEEGEEALGEQLGIFGKKAALSKTPVGIANTTAAIHSPIGSSSSNIAISGHGAIETTVEENTERTDVNKFLEQEICNNIYMSCLAKVTMMSLAERQTAEGISQEMKEWAAAEKKAIRDVSKSKKILEKAARERETAGKKLDSFKASLHGKAYIDEAYYEFQVKELAEKLAEARVTTAEATLFAIEVKDTAQSAGAADDIKEAIEEEKNAYDVLEAATANTSLTSSEEVHTTIASSSSKQDQGTPITPRKNSMEEERTGSTQNSINLLVAPQRSLSPTPSRLPVSGFKTVATEQTFATPSIPVATAVEFSPANNFTIAEPLNQQLKISEEKDVKETALALAKKEKVTAFETEFSSMIKNAEDQIEKAVEVATAAQEKAENLGTSEKAWNDAIKKAGKAESAYTHLIGYYKMYTEQAAEHYEGGILNAKRSQYNFALQDAEEEKTEWTTTLEECRQRK
ncbi:MAG TPA: hypothetical protein VJK54_09300, partial [Chthoniobacterales bacterium]|nr:hypothetical protein [Chthoniobacterales bacterium]